MYPPHYLEWFYKGAWHRIAWDASTPASVTALRGHAARLVAEKGGHYRLVTPSIYCDAPPCVVQEWSERAA